MDRGKIIKEYKEWVEDVSNDLEDKSHFTIDEIVSKVCELVENQIKNNVVLADVSQQRELLIAFDTMREFDIKHDDIEESVEYFLKNKESYL